MKVEFFSSCLKSSLFQLHPDALAYVEDRVLFLLFQTWLERVGHS